MAKIHFTLRSVFRLIAVLAVICFLLTLYRSNQRFEEILSLFSMVSDGSIGIKNEYCDWRTGDFAWKIATNKRLVGKLCISGPFIPKDGFANPQKVIPIIVEHRKTGSYVSIHIKSIEEAKYIFLEIDGRFDLINLEGICEGLTFVGDGTYLCNGVSNRLHENKMNEPVILLRHSKTPIGSNDIGHNAIKTDETGFMIWIEFAK